MKSEIKDFFGSGLDCSLESYIPEEKDNFGVLLDIEVGIQDEEGSDVFYITLCTPKWLIENQANDKIILGLHYLIMFKYDYKILYDKLQELFCIEGKDWEEIATKLSYIGHWEFQDYQEYIEE